MSDTTPSKKPFNRQASAQKFLKALDEYQAATTRILALTRETKDCCGRISAISKSSIETINRFRG